MMFSCRTMLALVVAMIGSAATGADETRVSQQKDAAKANWRRLFDSDPPVQYETAHFLLYAPASIPEKQLKALGPVLEAQLALALKALRADAKKELWSGKLAVYLLDDRRQLQSFIREVAKKRPDPDDLGVFSLRSDNPFLAAGPPRSKRDPTLEAQAGEQLGVAIITKLSGPDVPDWLIGGFGRASVWRAAPATTFSKEQRKWARDLVRAGASASALWKGKLQEGETRALAASLADFLAFGPGAKSFSSLLEGFKSEQGKPRKTTEDALKTAKITAERLNVSWQAWVLAGRY